MWSALMGTVAVRAGLGFWVYTHTHTHVWIEIQLMYNWMCFESRTDRKHRPRVELGVGWEVGQSVCVPVASRPRPPLPSLVP